MRRMLAVGLLSLAALAMPAQGALEVGLGTGQYESPANDWYCGGRTYTLTFSLQVVGDEGLATLYAVSGDCQDVWPEMHVRGSFAQGFQGYCSELLPTPCVLLTMAPLVHGGHTAISVDGPNVGTRVGFVVLP